MFGDILVGMVKLVDEVTFGSVSTTLDVLSDAENMRNARKRREMDARIDQKIREIKRQEEYDKEAR